MTPMTLTELDSLLVQNPEYLAAERELRPDLNLANDVIVLRVEAGWSQAELAAEVGTDQANISRLESSLANPTLKFLKKVARALDAELDVRLRRHDDNSWNRHPGKLHWRTKVRHANWFCAAQGGHELADAGCNASRL